MKKLAVILMVTGMFIFCSNDVFARAIGLKIIYNNMMGDYDSPMEFDNNISGGLFFDVGVFGFQSLDFRPGLDFVKMKNDAATWGTIWGFHCDWYWFFMEKGSFAPFIGFGPALNYLDYKNNEGAFEEDDTDVGIEGFGGVEFAATGQIKLILELRLVVHDIADTDKQIFKPSLGASYSF